MSPVFLGALAVLILAVTQSNKVTFSELFAELANREQVLQNAIDERNRVQNALRDALRTSGPIHRLDTSLTPPVAEVFLASDSAQAGERGFVIIRAKHESEVIRSS